MLSRNVWALRGADGSVEKDWPIRVGRRLTSNVLLTRLSSNKLVLVSDHIQSALDRLSRLLRHPHFNAVVFHLQRFEFHCLISHCCHGFSFTKV